MTITGVLALLTSQTRHLSPEVNFGILGHFVILTAVFALERASTGIVDEAHLRN